MVLGLWLRRFSLCKRPSKRQGWSSSRRTGSKALAYGSSKPANPSPNDALEDPRHKTAARRRWPTHGPVTWEFAKRTQLLQCKSAHDALNPGAVPPGAHRVGRSIVLQAENDRVERAGGEASRTSLGTSYSRRVGRGVARRQLLCARRRRRSLRQGFGDDIDGFAGKGGIRISW
jgi:hypothetical protein